MQELLKHIIDVSPSALIAGVAGAFLNFLHKTNIAIQARITGFLISITCVIYLVPFVMWLLEWKFEVKPHRTIEHILSLVIGLISQKIVEDFIDNPFNTVFSITKKINNIKTAIFTDTIAVKEEEKQ